MFVQTLRRASVRKRRLANRLRGARNRVQGAAQALRGQVIVLVADPARDDLVDPHMVVPAARHQPAVPGLVVVDHRQQRLRQVVVDVRVHAEQQVAQRRQRARSAERGDPRPGRLIRLERRQVVVGEGDVPGFHPRGIDEEPGLETFVDSERHPPVNGQKVLSRVASGPKVRQEHVHPLDERRDLAFLGRHADDSTR